MQRFFSHFTLHGHRCGCLCCRPVRGSRALPASRKTNWHFSKNNKLDEKSGEKKTAAPTTSEYKQECSENTSTMLNLRRAAHKSIKHHQRKCKKYPFWLKLFRLWKNSYLASTRPSKVPNKNLLVDMLCETFLHTTMLRILVSGFGIRNFNWNWSVPVKTPSVATFAEKPSSGTISVHALVTY